MKQSIKIVFTFLFIATFTSCLTHFYTKDEIIKLDKKRVKKKIEGSIMIDDKNNVVLTMLRDSNYQEMESIFYFNTKGKQIKHTLINSCDSCFKKNVSAIIAENIYGWKKLNDSTYFSRYSISRVLYIHPSTYSFDVVKHNLSKKEYQALLKNVRQ